MRVSYKLSDVATRSSYSGAAKSGSALFVGTQNSHLHKNVKLFPPELFIVHPTFCDAYVAVALGGVRLV